MGRTKQPINLVKYNGKSHLTKEEIKQREKTEVKAPSDRIVAPDYLTSKQREKFVKISNELVKIGIMSNLDCDLLARHIKCQEQYLKYDKMLKISLKNTSNIEGIEKNILIIEKLEGLKDKAFKQCQATSKELGLTITSRCKLVVPQPKEKKKENKFAKFSGGVANG